MAANYHLNKMTICKRFGPKLKIHKRSKDIGQKKQNGDGK